MGAGNPTLLGWSAGPRGANLVGMTTDQLTRNKHLVESLIQELFTKGDLTAVDRYLADDFINHDPPFPGAPDGAEGLRHAAEVIRSAVPDWRSDADHYIAEGDLVVEHFHAYGTRIGELFGAPPDGRMLVLRGIHIFRIAGDKIVERWGPAAAWSTEGEPSQGFGGPALAEQLTRS
jgi:predicted SnoaL-like aldol condensation-catalyzing enzyme